MGKVILLYSFISEQDMLFDQSSGKKITSNTSEIKLEKPNHSCKRTYCAMLCTGYFDCVAFNAKITRPCVCELFFSLSENSGTTNNTEWMAALRLPDY